MENLPAVSRSLMLPTTSSLEQKSSNARAILSTSRPGPVDASKAAKRLTGQFANLRADNATEFMNSVAAILSKYPLGLVEEMLNTRALPLKVEFCSLKSLGAWLDERLAYYEACAKWTGPPPIRPEIEPGPVTAERIAALLTDLAAELRASNSRSPLDQLLDQRAAMRRESIDRILGYAARVAPRDAAE